MDFTLICRQIQELLVKDESFTLPDVGKFSILTSPASFLDSGKGILPPVKQLVFEQGIHQGGFAPWQQELSGKIVDTLSSEGVCEIDGFGTFSKTEDNISFKVSPEFDFAPDSFSLEAITLETIEPEPEPAPAPAPAPSPAPMPEQKKQNMALWGIIAVIVILLAVLFIFLFRESFAEMLKGILYSKEELEIIDKWSSL